jgi:hypothetical protein
MVLVADIIQEAAEIKDHKHGANFSVDDPIESAYCACAIEKALAVL